MTDSEKIVYTAIAAFIGAFILWVIQRVAGYVRTHISDKCKVETKLSITSHADILQYVGNSCLLVRIVGKSNRASRIKDVELSVKVDRAFIESFDKGFNVPFSQGFSEKLPPPTLSVQLIRSYPSSGDVVMLGRDDVAEYLLPVPFQMFPHFLQAPSQDVEIAMYGLDGERTILRNGLEIQQMIGSIVESQGGSLHLPHVVMNVKLNISSVSPPDTTSAVGQVNPNPIEPPVRRPPDGQ